MPVRGRLALGAVGLGSVSWWGATAGGLPLGTALLVVVGIIGVGWCGVELLVLRPLGAQARDLRRRLHDRGAPAVPSPALVPELEVLDQAIGLANDEFDHLIRKTRMSHEVIAASSVGVALLDHRGLITEVNSALLAMFRFRAAPIGRRPIEVVSSVDLHLVVEDAMANGDAERSFVTESSDLVAKAHRLSSGVLLRVEDVTAQREAERARHVFVANVSHELRTPLTAILGYLETMLMDEARLPDDLVRMLHVVDRNAKRLRELFDDLLRLHRIESRRRELPMDDEALRPILESAVGSARDQARMRGQSFVLDCPDDLVAFVNRDALSAIVSNLASNASAYSGDKGSICVVAQRHGRCVDVRVEDDGMGIDLAHHERIFQRFYRVDEARDRRAGGTGLGLAIVKHYALACGFDIQLQSALGEGSTFTVHMPDAS